MAMCGLNHLVDSGKINKDTKVLIQKGRTLRFYQYGKHEYWDKFFKLYNNKVIKVQTLLDYPEMKNPEWLITDNLLRNMTHSVGTSYVFSKGHNKRKHKLLKNIGAIDVVQYIDAIILK